MTLHALGTPRPARVSCDPDGVPRAVEIEGRPRAVEAVRDDWLVQDLWWTGRTIDRHYYELVVEPGRLVVVYREAGDAGWFAH